MILRVFDLPLGGFKIHYLNLTVVKLQNILSGGVFWFVFFFPLQFFCFTNCMNFVFVAVRRSDASFKYCTKIRISVGTVWRMISCNFFYSVTQVTECTRISKLSFLLLQRKGSFTWFFRLVLKWEFSFWDNSSNSYIVWLWQIQEKKYRKIFLTLEKLWLHKLFV